MIIFKPILWLIKIVSIVFIIFLCFMLLKTHPHPLLYMRHETVIVLKHSEAVLNKAIAWINPKGA